MTNKIALPRKVGGFSLLEILVVLVILGILVSLVAPAVLNRVDDARLQKVHADIAAIETALSIYKLDNFRYPTTEQSLQALVSPPELEPLAPNWKAGGYLKEIPLDPWGKPYVYLFPGINSRQDGGAYPDVFTLGADGISGGNGQDADVGNWKQAVQN
jgi:general secretion pathway protein G